MCECTPTIKTPWCKNCRPEKQSETLIKGNTLSHMVYQGSSVEVTERLTYQMQEHCREGVSIPLKGSDCRLLISNVISSCSSDLGGALDQYEIRVEGQIV